MDQVIMTVVDPEGEDRRRRRSGDVGREPCGRGRISERSANEEQVRSASGSSGSVLFCFEIG